jgi:hypothetical protein
LASFSNFSMNLLRDSGWFDVDFSKAEVFEYGRNGGCDFFNNVCNSATNDPLTEACSGTSNPFGCSADHLGRSACISDSFVDKGCNF